MNAKLLHQPNGYWGVVYRDTLVVLQDESYQVACNVEAAINLEGAFPATEANEIALAFAAAYECYPTPRRAPAEPLELGDYERLRWIDQEGRL